MADSNHMVPSKRSPHHCHLNWIKQLQTFSEGAANYSLCKSNLKIAETSFEF